MALKQRALNLALDALKADIEDSEGDAVIVLLRGEKDGWRLFAPQGISEEELPAIFDEAKRHVMQLSRKHQRGNA